MLLQPFYSLDAVSWRDKMGLKRNQNLKKFRI